jgi:hypothetical protein
MMSKLSIALVVQELLSNAIWETLYGNWLIVHQQISAPCPGTSGSFRTSIG